MEEGGSPPMDPCGSVRDAKRIVTMDGNADSKPTLRIAIIGTDGLPARYGGFETCVEQLAPRLAELGHHVEVFGSSFGRTSRAIDGVLLQHRYLPLRANGWSSVPYDLFCFLACYAKSDAIVIMGVSGGIFLPFMRLLAGHRRLVVNVDGLEARRSKWQGAKRAFLRLSEALAIRYAHAVVSDNQGIADIVVHQHGRTTTVIPYGNDHVINIKSALACSVVQQRFGLEPQAYLLTVARVEPENQIEEMIGAFLASNLDRYAIVGNFSSTKLGCSLLQRYRAEPRLLFIDSLFEPQALAALRACCRIYLHGHSVGGSNPSLIEMLPYHKPLLVYDCVFNRHTLQSEGGYFCNGTDLVARLRNAQLQEWIPSQKTILCYQWKKIANDYEKLCIGKNSPTNCS